jgi:hypothetical protein
VFRSREGVRERHNEGQKPLPQLLETIAAISVFHLGALMTIVLTAGSTGREMATGAKSAVNEDPTHRQQKQLGWPGRCL